MPVMGIISVVSLNQTRKIQVGGSKTKFPKLMYIAFWIFYLSALLFAIFRPINTALWCFAPDFQGISHQILATMYAFHWYALILVLYSRLTHVFKDSAYAINRTTLSILRISIIISFILVFICLVLQIWRIVHDWILFVSIGIVLIVLIIIAQFLAWTFVYKLWKINSDRVDIADKQDPKSQEVNVKMLRQVKKYSVLGVISVMFTTFYALVEIVASIFGYRSFAVVETFGFMIAMDMFVDTVCMALSLGVNNRYYKYLCFIFDRNVFDYNHQQLEAVVAANNNNQ